MRRFDAARFAQLQKLAEQQDYALTLDPERGYVLADNSDWEHPSFVGEGGKRNGSMFLSADYVEKVLGLKPVQFN
jgi:hypothetical protein